MNFAARRRVEALVDITPLIDIIFQLVLFFMVTTTFVTTPGIEVDLPRSSAETILRDQEDLKVWITAEGAVYVDDEPVDTKGLQAALRQASRTDKGTLIIIKADQNVDHGRVVAVMDMARSKGLSRLAIATEANRSTGGTPEDGTGGTPEEGTGGTPEDEDGGGTGPDEGPE